MPHPPCVCIVTTDSASSGERAAVVWRECRADRAATPMQPSHRKAASCTSRRGGTAGRRSSQREEGGRLVIHSQVQQQAPHHCGEVRSNTYVCGY